MSESGDVTDEQVSAARNEAYRRGIRDPFMARVHEHPDLAALNEADAEAEQNNIEAWRAVLRAAAIR